jgi:branched-subunit amino acid ABC-type transport system permease component
MNTGFWLIQAFNGVSFGALLFLVGSGLSLIFGVMRIVNLFRPAGGAAANEQIKSSFLGI